MSDLDYRIYKQIWSIYIELVQKCTPIIKDQGIAFNTITDEKKIFKPKRRKTRNPSASNIYSFTLNESDSYWKILQGLPGYNQRYGIQVDNFEATFLFYTIIHIKYEFEKILPKACHKWYLKDYNKPKELI